MFTSKFGATETRSPAENEHGEDAEVRRERGR